MQAKRREKSKVMEEGQLKSFNGDLMDMSRFDSRNESRVTETSFIDSVCVYYTFILSFLVRIG